MAEPVAVQTSVNNIVDAIKYAQYIDDVIRIVTSIQAIMGPGDGEKKKAAARIALAGILEIAEGVSKQDWVNNEEAAALLDEGIELGVGLMQLKPRIESMAARLRDIRGTAGGDTL